MKQWFSVTGRLVQAPPRTASATRPVVRRGFWLVAQVDPELVAYYRWHAARGVADLDGPPAGAEVQVVRGVTLSPGHHPGASMKRVEVPMKMGVQAQHDFDGWWLPVQAPALEHLRVSLGLPRQPRGGFRLLLEG